ncbi:MAG TPA: hypothetical protein PK253_18840 [Spirochaetota bacterium]|mgnify:CR=1 FL=1|nr:hypothetical protein [Spirochaetota bacterium]
MNDRYSEVNYAVSTMKRGLVIYTFFTGIRGVSDLVGDVCAKLIILLMFFVYVLCGAAPKYLYLRLKGRELDARGDNFGDKVARAWYRLVLRKPVEMSPRFVKKTIATLSRTEEGRQCLAHIREHGIWEKGPEGV